MLWLANNAEGGSHGTAVTTANSGGGSGDAFGASTGATSTRAFDNTVAAHGLLSYKLINTINQANFLAWTALTLAGTELWFRKYVSFPSFTAEQIRLIQGQNAAGACAIVNVTSAGKVAVANSAGTVLATSTAGMSTSTIYRLEGYWNLLAAAGTNRVSFYTGDGTTPIDTVTGSGNLRGAINEFRFGMAASGTTVAHTIFFDDIAITDVAPSWFDDLGNNYIGPAHNKMTLLPKVAPPLAVVRANQW